MAYRFMFYKGDLEIFSCSGTDRMVVSKAFGLAKSCLEHDSYSFEVFSEGVWTEAE